MKAPFQVLYSNDLTNIECCVSLYHKKGELFRIICGLSVMYDQAFSIAWAIGGAAPNAGISEGMTGGAELSHGEWGMECSPCGGRIPAEPHPLAVILPSNESAFPSLFPERKRSGAKHAQLNP